MSDTGSMISLKSHRLKAAATSLRALRKSSRIAPFPASRRLHLRVWKSTQLPSANEGERRGGRAIEEEEDTRDGGRRGRERERERKWSHVEVSSRVESTLRENLGVRPEHIGFSGESWSMFPGSWLTRGIGYKATRPADWFILSATPAHAVLSRNHSVCLSLFRSSLFQPPLLCFSLSRFYLSCYTYLSIRLSVSLHR